MMVAAALSMGVAGCAGANRTVDSNERPFFQAEYAEDTHGRKTVFDRLVELDPGDFKVTVSPEYMENPPERIAVLPFVDLGSAQFVLDKVPLTFRDKQQKARWAWTDAQRLRRGLTGYLAAREFMVVNPIGIDAVLAEHNIRNINALDEVGPQKLGEWLGADAVIYGKVIHYESYYAFLVSGWQVSIDLRMVSTHDGATLIRATGSRYDINLMPAIDPQDILINSGLALLELRDVNLARSENEVCREIVLRIPTSQLLRDRIADEAREHGMQSDLRTSREPDTCRSKSHPPLAAIDRSLPCTTFQRSGLRHPRQPQRSLASARR